MSNRIGFVGFWAELVLINYLIESPSSQPKDGGTATQSTGLTKTFYSNFLLLKGG